MLSSRHLRLLVSTLILTVCLGAMLSLQVLAQTDTPTASPTPKLVLENRFPAISGDVGQTFSFNVDIKYYDPQRTTFNLIATPPSGWTASVTGNQAKQISAIDMAAYSATTPGIETITITFTPSYSNLPSPGVYKGNIKVSNGTLSETMDLRATVIARYYFTVDWTDPTTGSTTTDVSMRGEAGKAATFPFDVTNSGSAAIEGLTFSANAPKDWSVVFSPATLSSLASNQTQRVSAEVTPPNRSNIAGDYVLTLKADNGSVSSKMTLRVNIPPSNTSVWLIVGVAGAVIVVLVVVYQFLGKKKSKTAAKAS